jgi:hypothetical protein
VIATRQRALLVADEPRLFLAAEAVLRERGFEVAPPGVELIGVPVAKTLRSAFRNADLAVFVLSRSGLSPTAAYELGVATGLATPLLIVSPPSARLPTAITARGLTVWADDENLSMVLSHALRAVKPRKKRNTAATGAGARDVPKLSSGRDDLAFYDLAPYAHPPETAFPTDDSGLEPIVRQLVESTGAIVATKAGRRSQPDLGVWMDELAGVVGTPLLIEVKDRISTVAQADRALKQVANYVKRSGTEWGLLVYEGHVDDAAMAERSQQWPVLPIRFEAFRDGIRSRGLVELVRELRSISAHD